MCLSKCLSFFQTKPLNQDLQLDTIDIDQNLEWLNEYSALFHLETVCRLCRLIAEAKLGFLGSSVQH